MGVCVGGRGIACLAVGVYGLFYGEVITNREIDQKDNVILHICQIRNYGTEKLG